MRISGKRIPRRRFVYTDRYIIAVDVEAVIPDLPGDDAGEACYESETVEFLREVEQHAHRGDLEWLKRHGRVYAALDAA